MKILVAGGILASAIMAGGVSFPALVLVSAPPPTAATTLTQALDDLHDGRFDAAEAALEAIPEVSAGPEVLFFRSFVTYWRLLYDDDNSDLRERLDRQIGTVVQRTEGKRGRRPSDALWAGSSRLLLAQLRAREKKPIAAAFEAKRARKDLQAVDPRHDQAAEALFGLGTYNYMAARLPAFVRGLRSLLFLPGGDRDLGLRQLERAARESRHFAVESRLLLVTISSNRHERLYDAALDHLARARRDFPDALVVAHAAAKLLIGLARPEEAAAILDRALARARRLEGVDAGVIGTLELLRARAEFSLFRPDLAASRAAALSTSRAKLPADVRNDAVALAAGSASLAASPWWPEALAVISEGFGAVPSGRPFPAATSGERAAVLGMLRGRAALAAGRGEEALARLAESEATGDLPVGWAGACRLLAGQAADLQGFRSMALGYYRRAETTPGFLAREAAMAYQVRPYTGDSR